MESTLVLNVSTEPLSIISGRRAVKLITDGKAISLDDSDKMLRSELAAYSIPYVIQVLEHVTVNERYRSQHRRIFSKRGVLVRDNHRCVYCGAKATTIDHVWPRALGGEDSYENCVACCEPCNSAKGSRTIEELGWSVPALEARKIPGPYYHMLFKSRRNSPQWDAWRIHVEKWSQEKMVLL